MGETDSNMVRLLHFLLLSALFKSTFKSCNASPHSPHPQGYEFLTREIWQNLLRGRRGGWIICDLDMPVFHLGGRTGFLSCLTCYTTPETSFPVRASLICRLYFKSFKNVLYAFLRTGCLQCILVIEPLLCGFGDNVDAQWRGFSIAHARVSLWQRVVSMVLLCLRLG